MIHYTVYISSGDKKLLLMLIIQLQNVVLLTIYVTSEVPYLDACWHLIICHPTLCDVLISESLARSWSGGWRSGRITWGRARSWR